MPFPEGMTNDSKLNEIQEGLDKLEPQTGKAMNGHLRNMTHMRAQFSDEELTGERVDHGGNGSVKGTPTEFPPDSPPKPAGL